VREGDDLGTTIIEHLCWQPGKLKLYYNACINSSVCTIDGKTSYCEDDRRHIVDQDVVISINISPGRDIVPTQDLLTLPLPLPT